MTMSDEEQIDQIIRALDQDPDQTPTVVAYYLKGRPGHLLVPILAQITFRQEANFVVAREAIQVILKGRAWGLIQ